MKTRTDFVSNSSSCSFMIKEPRRFIELVNRELGSSQFCKCFSSLTFMAYVAVADRVMLENIYDAVCIYEFDNKACAAVPLDKLIAMNDNALSKLKAIELKCNDFETSNVAKLSVLKRALANANIKVDSSASEHCLLFEDDDEQQTMANLYAMAFAKDV